MQKNFTYKMDVNGIPLTQFLDLPYELQCQIISDITEYRDIRRLRLVSPYMRWLLQNCIEEVNWRYIKNEPLTINTDILITLRNVRIIESIYPETVTDVVNLANLPHLER